MRAIAAGVLAALALAAGLPPAAPGFQEAGATREDEAGESRAAELRRTVELACEGRITIRPQAARRLLAAGEEAIPHVREYARKRGPNALSPSLVEGLGGVPGETSRALLLELVEDLSFYWRPHAVRGLGRLAHPEDLPLLRGLVADRAGIVRQAAAQALALAGDRDAGDLLRGLLADEDVRPRLAAAKALVELEGDESGLPVLVEALKMDHEFFGDPAGLRARMEAFSFLRELAGETLEYDPSASRGERLEAAGRFEAWARGRLQDRFDLPENARYEPDDASYLVGVELRTCNLGEMYLRLDGEGRLAVGLERPERITLDPRRAESIRGAAAREPEGGSRVHGRVICDYERLCGLGPGGNHVLQAAPGSRPAPWEELIQAFVQALVCAGRADLAEAVRKRSALFDLPG